MNYDEFFAEIREQKIELRFDNPNASAPSRLSNEALFHLPLIAMTILVLAKDRRKPMSRQIGQLIGECFERSFSGFKGSSQHLGWSANLRVRTVKALTFLEQALLVQIDKNDSRISATPLGHAVVDRALSVDSNLAYTVKLLQRQYRNISVENNISARIE